MAFGIFFQQLLQLSITKPRMHILQLRKTNTVIYNSGIPFETINEAKFSLNIAQPLQFRKAVKEYWHQHIPGHTPNVSDHGVSWQGK